MTATEMRPPTWPDLCAELQKIYEKSKTFNRLVTTDAKIAQTPKTSMAVESLMLDIRAKGAQRRAARS